MGIAVYFLFPLIIVACAAGLGVIAVALFAPKKLTGKSREQRLVLAMWLAPGLPVIAALSLLLARSKEFADLYGEFMEKLWLWSFVSFLIGIAVGWGHYRHDDVK